MFQDPVFSSVQGVHLLHGGQLASGKYVRIEVLGDSVITVDILRLVAAAVANG